MNKISAFTLSELLVVLLLSSILVVALYQGFGFLQFHYNNFEKNRTDQLNLQTLYFQLDKDFNQAHKVEGETRTLRCVMNNYEVTYSFYRNLILRKQVARTDTFYCQPKDLTMKFDQEKLQAFDRLVDELSFDCHYKGQNMVFHFTKQYGADLLMLKEGSRSIF